MRARLQDESGFTLVELLVVSALTLVILGGASNMFVSGLRASSTSDARLTAQESVGTALDRLEFETRCADSATLVSSGAGVALTLPSWCPNATGNVAWCITGGALERVPGATDCTSTGQVLIRDVTSATPFSCISTDGALPQLQVALTVDAGTGSSTSTATSETDTIALRNADDVVNGVSACT